ncbi:MAG: hypothetical protein P3W96_006620 [Halomonas sp.]|jgi:hypothetical protein|nr:hypothetical protein [Halomonas sp.]MDM7481677.1 hypothetical protein [Halomonas sp.]
MTNETPPTPRRRSPLIYALVAVILVALVWLAGSYWLLNSQWLPRQISTIDGVEVRWSSAQSLHPGRWEVENLYLARDDAALPLSVEAERATLSLSLLALLRGELYLHALNADGIRRLTVGDLALEAEGQLQVMDTQLSQDRLALPHVSLDITQGSLVRLSDQTILIQQIDLRSTASLAETATQALRGEALEEALLSALDARLSLTAQADAWDVFMPYLEALPWLNLAGRGELQGELALVAGELQPDSELVLTAPVLELALDEQRLARRDEARRWLLADASPPRHTATGEGQVRLAVEEQQLRFSTRLAQVTLAEATPSDTRPYATDTQLTLATELPNQRLDQLALPTHATLALSGQVTRLDMLDRYLATTLEGQGIRLTGEGSIDARLALRDARPYQAELAIEAPALGAALLDFTTQGQGTLNAQLNEDEQLHATLALRDAELYHQTRQLMANAQLTLDATSPLDPEQARQHATARLSWAEATLPDLGVLQPYLAGLLPFPTPLTLQRGSATSRGQLEFDTQAVQGELHLAGNQLTTGWQRGDQRGTLVSNAQLQLTIRQAALDGTALDISGSRLRWQVADEHALEEPLESIIVLRDGQFQRRAGVPSGQFRVDGSVQRLSFLNAFLPDAHGISLSGEGQLFLQGAFRDDQFQAPTRLRVNANELAVTFLDYLATGRGELTAQLDSSEQARLSLGIPQFALSHQDDGRPHLQGRHLALTTQTDRFSEMLEAAAPEHFVTRIVLPITEVPDMTRYNRFLPDDAGVELLSGHASLSSEWLLEGLQAQGEITLRAFETELALLDQRLRGDIAMQLRLTDGDLDARRFTASDSYVRLENMFRQSEEGAQDAGWWVQLDLQQARLVWGDPLQLTSQLRLGMRDSGLLARLFLARARERDWLGRLLDVQPIEGSAELNIDGEQIRLANLALTGGPLLLLSDITLAHQQANGALYARLGALGIGVELVESEPTLRVIQPRRWFDQWRATQRP